MKRQEERNDFLQTGEVGGGDKMSCLSEQQQQVTATERKPVHWEGGWGVKS